MKINNTHEIKQRIQELAPLLDQLRKEREETEKQSVPSKMTMYPFVNPSHDISKVHQNGQFLQVPTPTSTIGKCRNCNQEWDGVSEHYCPVFYEDTFEEKRLKYVKEFATQFFFYWYNQPGSNTLQGYDAFIQTEKGKKLLSDVIDPIKRWKNEQEKS